MRVKCRSDGVIVPDSACSGVSDVPVISPTGVRAGVTNGDRVPTAVVGAPGTFVGSAGASGGGGRGAAPSPAALRPGKLREQRAAGGDRRAGDERASGDRRARS